MESCLPEIKKKIQNFIKLFQLPTIRTLRNSNEFFVPLRVRIIESLQTLGKVKSKNPKHPNKVKLLVPYIKLNFSKVSK